MLIDPLGQVRGHPNIKRPPLMIGHDVDGGKHAAFLAQTPHPVIPDAEGDPGPKAERRRTSLRRTKEPAMGPGYGLRPFRDDDPEGEKFKPANPIASEIVALFNSGAS